MRSRSKRTSVYTSSSVTDVISTSPWLNRRGETCSAHTNLLWMLGGLGVLISVSLDVLLTSAVFVSSFLYTDALKVLDTWGPGCHLLGHSLDSSIDELETLLETERAQIPTSLLFSPSSPSFLQTRFYARQISSVSEPSPTGTTSS